MSVEANKAQTRQIVDQAWNKGNIDALDELMSADFRAAHLPTGVKDAHFFAQPGNGMSGLPADQVRFCATVDSRFAQDPRRLRGEEVADGDDDEVQQIRAALCEISWGIFPSSRWCLLRKSRAVRVASKSP